MLKSKYLIPFLFLLALLAACHYRPMYIPGAILPVSIRGRMR